VLDGLSRLRVADVHLAIRPGDTRPYRAGHMRLTVS
jgi:hypothetical protein